MTVQELVQGPLRRRVSDTTGKGTERTHEILVAAREVFALEGYAGLSMRGVAARIGATLGSVQHYYPTKDRMLEAMLSHSSGEYQARVNRIIASMPDAPKRERFLAAMAYLVEETRVPASRGMLLESLALAGRHSYAAKVCEQMIGRARRTIRQLIAGVAPDLGEPELDVRAALVLAQILGLLFSPAGERREGKALDRAAREAMLDIATKPARPLVPDRPLAPESNSKNKKRR